MKKLKNENLDDQFNLTMALGKMHQDSRNMTKAIEFFEQARELATNTNQQVNVLLVTGNAKRILQDLENAETILKNALNIALGAKDNESVGLITRNLGLVYMQRSFRDMTRDIEQIDNVIKYFRSSCSYLKGCNLEEELTTSYILLGLSLLRKGDLTSLIESNDCFEKAGGALGINCKKILRKPSQYIPNQCQLELSASQEKSGKR